MCPSFQPLQGVWWAFVPTLWAFGQVPTAFESANFFVRIHKTLSSTFNFLHCSQILCCLKTIAKYRNVHASLCTLCLHACKYCSGSVNIIVSIHWTLLSIFHFLHYPQILHCLKYIEIYRNMHAHVCPFCLHACT